MLETVNLCNLSPPSFRSSLLALDAGDILEVIVSGSAGWPGELSTAKHTAFYMPGAADVLMSIQWLVACLLFCVPLRTWTKDMFMAVGWVVD